ncbi:MAG: hypothetical protein US89_C0004G0038 [Candidatus Peregrinibacteria bacterium GW2011_GWF2_38_29]|nr:MAG: hypothetical protein US89_C0004G0038 [Candidatus Peregrinibacteria bacterium GW2011_GWF2_38_29]HBB02975.1 hypothetical protein [Candidatus Peregrinibacteria bacterium]
MNKKIFVSVLMSIFAFSLFDFAVPMTASAEVTWGILPGTTLDVETCRKNIRDNENAKDQNYGPELIACAIKTGEIHMGMVPYFITYFIKFLLGIAGLISVLFILFGSYQWTVAGITEKQDAAKKTITHAIMGLVVVLLAFAVVSIVQAVVTS